MLLAFNGRVILSHRKHSTVCVKRNYKTLIVNYSQRTKHGWRPTAATGGLLIYSPLYYSACILSVLLFASKGNYASTLGKTRPDLEGKKFIKITQ